MLASVFAQRRGYRRRCSSSDRCWRAPRHRGATCGRRDRLFHRVDTCRIAPSVFLTTLYLDNRRTRGASRARPSPRGCLLLIVAFYVSTLATTVATIAIVAIVVELSSSYRRQCDPCRDCRVTVMPFLGVLAQRALLARRSLRRFIDVVIVVVAALSAFRRVPRSSLLCCCRCRRNDDYRR